jgi:hypothetical protein
MLSRLLPALHEQTGLRTAGQVAPESRQSPFAGDAGLAAQTAVSGFLDEAEVD